MSDEAQYFIDNRVIHAYVEPEDGYIVLEFEGGAETCVRFERDVVKLCAENERLREAYSSVLGWRENDWPSWFCRATAEALADRAREALEEGG